PIHVAEEVRCVLAHVVYLHGHRRKHLLLHAKIPRLNEGCLEMPVEDYKRSTKVSVVQGRRSGHRRRGWHIGQYIAYRVEQRLFEGGAPPRIAKQFAEAPIMKDAVPAAD